MDNRRNSFRLCGPSAALLVATALLAGCMRRNNYVAPPPPDVVVATAEQRTITIYHEYTGNTSASATIQIRSRVSGYLEKIGFEDGVTVKKDQLLFVIDPRPYAAVVADAKALLESRKATVTQQDSIYKRDVALLPMHAVATQQADVDKGNLLVAKAGVGQAQATLEQGQLNLGFTDIRAPIAGHIDRHLVDRGNLVSADTTLLTTLYQWDPMWVYFTVPEINYLEYIKRQREGGEPRPQEDAPKAEPAQPPGAKSKNPPNKHAPGAAETRNPVEIGLSNESGYPHRGYIDFAQPTVETISGTLLIRGVFENPEPYLLRPGLFVRVRVPIGTQEAALLVPESAIGTDQAGNYLLIVGQDDKVERRAVTTGAREGTMRVIAEGLRPGEKFVVEGLQLARPGVKVKATMKKS